MAYEIPLRNRDGEIIAVAKVDRADWKRLSPYRWSLMRGGYAVGTMSTGRYERDYQRGPRVGGALPQVYMHRVIMDLKSGDRRKVDHVNRNRLDNRRSNLRIVDDKAHAQNQTKQPHRHSKYRGVSFNKRRGKWIAYGTLNSKRVYLGCAYEHEEEAAAAAAEWRAKNMPYSEEGTA